MQRLSRRLNGAGSTERFERADLLLVCSAGGHVLQLNLLRVVWESRSRLWVTDPREDARSLLAGERVVYAYWPTTRNLLNLLRNVTLAIRVMREARPRLVLTTGAAIAVPCAWVGRAFGAKVVYIESITRIERPSLSCRLVAPIAERVYVQWPELAERVRGARYAGSVLPMP